MTYRLFSWEHSYFSGKARAYLRYKQRMGGLGPGFEDVLATPELILGLLTQKSGSGAVPQLEAPDGTWVQDTSEIIDFIEARHPEPVVSPDPATSPRQAVVSYLIELLADEWMVVPGFWARWYFSEDGRSPSHRGANEQTWGAVFGAGQPGDARRAAAAMLFEKAFGISHSRTDPIGVYGGLVHLGVTEKTEMAWQASQHRILGLLEAHFSVHDYVLGGRPSLGDFALMGPLYAHLYRDAVSGFALRTHFPLVCEWVERTNGEGALNARTYDQKLYSLGPDGALVGRPANSDGADWLPDDTIPETCSPSSPFSSRRCGRSSSRRWSGSRPSSRATPTSPAASSRARPSSPTPASATSRRATVPSPTSTPWARSLGGAWWSRTRCGCWEGCTRCSRPRSARPSRRCSRESRAPSSS